ncbi:FecR family protein [Bradyrhizobium roseum]|uniref:FecR family protein n=1 Tax=Bradyrhizobium roseum TaxID=3056648 RepID=UPI0026069D5D|nr:FecR domain-containing protein [Bradyrhizobium roseus]WKA26130.1 FecR domain-containing protein [Bradyrhizobium roseus]
MTAADDTAGDDPLLEESLDWVARLKGGAPTRADVEALQRWRDQSPAHEEAFKAAARIFRNAGLAAGELADRPDAFGVAPVLHGNSRSVFARRAFLGGAVAAGAVGYLVVRPPLGMWPSLEELSADYRTGKGEQRKIAVSSDVSLELNTQTSIAMRSAPNETRIELISGEASVAAKRPSPKPFVMLAANGRISASHADFNARCLDGNVRVTCLNGTVDVTLDGKAVQLRSAEQVSYSSGGFEVTVPVDPSQVAAWQTGLLIFRDQTLADVVDEVNRYRSGKIIITNAELKLRVVNGTFQISKLGDFVLQVQQLFGAQARSLPGGVVLLG